MKQTILVVDDEPENITILGNILNQNYNVLAASSSAATFDILNKQKVDLILLDILMPEMDGYEVCRRLKQNEKTQATPVIFISALTSLEDRMKGFNAGANDYITKPIVPEDVIATVKFELENNLEIINQKHTIEDLSENVKNSNTLISEIEMINYYLLELFSADSIDNIASCLIEFIKKINHNGIISLELSDTENRRISTDKHISTLAISILNKAKKSSDTSMIASNKLLIHKGLVTVLINLDDDEASSKRLKDSLSKIIEGANIALSNLLQASQKDKLEDSDGNEKSSQINECYGRTQSILSMVESQLQIITNKNQKIIEELIDNVNESFMGLGLTESQENEIISLIENTEKKVISVTQENDELKNKISLAKNLLKL